MSILRPKYSRILINDCKGVPCEVFPLPLDKRRSFVAYQELIAEMQTENPDMTISDLYDVEDHFAYSVDESLRLYGLSPERVGLIHCVQLFFAYDGGQGLCWRLEFSPNHKKGKLLDPETDPYHAAIAAFWSFMPDRSLKEVKEAIDSMPWVEVEGIMQARNQQIEEAHPELKRPTEEDMGEFIEDLKGGFGGLADGPPVGDMLSKVMG